jgi:DNA polymerase III epsilon subunit-like protein
MATKQQTPEFGLCIDWETSGADFGKDSSINYQGITCGAIVFRTKDFSVVDELYLEIKFDATKYKWTEGAQKIHGKTREYLEANGISQEDAAVQLVEFIKKYFFGSKVMFLGHNPEFDRRFTAQLLKTIRFEFTDEPKGDLDAVIELHHVRLDTSALGFITLGFFKSDLLFNKIGGDEYARGEHNALVDARMTVETCASIKKLVEISLE